MSTKEKRDRLFAGARPVIRELQIFDNGKPHKDIGLLWVSYTKGGFELFPKGMTQPEFLEFIVELSKDVGMFIVDDFHKEYGGKMGPLCFISIKQVGQRIEPHSDVFPWATARNILRGTVAFFQMIRYQKIGCSVTFALARSKPLFDKVQEYGVLNYVGMIPNGDPWGRGDEYVYTIRGRK